ncbi:MAG TPA: trypsin-like peptidase domain-containing protein [Jatrophihabitans sp.]
MSDDQGSHGADGAERPDESASHESASHESALDQAALDEAFRRPPGLNDPFAPRRPPPPYTPPPPTISPEDRAGFGRPDGAGPYAPPVGERVPPQHTQAPTVPWIMTSAFGAPAEAQGGFAPEPGTRIEPSETEPQSPWWKHDALRDPWRDPGAAFWLGRGAVFASGQPAQLDPSLDEEHLDDAEPAAPEEDESAKVMAMPRRFGLKALLLGLIIALVAGAVGGFGGYFLAGTARDALHRTDVSLPQGGVPANRPPGSVAAIAKKIGPAVVSLAVTSADKSRSGVGSGVVIDRHGDVLTNNHVAAVAKDGGTIIATFSNEATARAQIVGLDPVSDIAVLKVPDDQLTVAPLGRSSTLAVGDPVVAIGSPLGLNGTVTAGIVSALNRPVHVFGDDGQSDAFLDAVQTDAAINPGNSGGALVDAGGRLVGINSAAALGTPNGTGGTTPTSGIGYAIPIDYAREIALELIKNGKAEHGSLNAQGRTAEAGLQAGAYLEQVEPKGAAAKAGLRNGDVIIVADDKPILSYDELVVIVQEHKPGDKINVTYYRGAAKRTATITLGSA